MIKIFRQISGQFILHRNFHFGRRSVFLSLFILAVTTNAQNKSYTQLASGLERFGLAELSAIRHQMTKSFQQIFRGIFLYGHTIITHQSGNSLHPLRTIIIKMCLI
jgi:hypothetical protein